MSGSAQARGDRVQQSRRRERFGEETSRSGIEGRSTDLVRRIASDHDHRRWIGQPPGCSDHVEPIAVRQPHVGDNQVRPLPAHRREALRARSRHHDVVALATEKPLARGQKIWLVVDDQDALELSHWFLDQVIPVPPRRASRRSMSLSVTIPTSRPASTTGSAPILCFSISRAASATGRRGPTVRDHGLRHDQLDRDLEQKIIELRVVAISRSVMMPRTSNSALFALAMSIARLNAAAEAREKSVGCRTRLIRLIAAPRCGEWPRSS